MRTIYDHAYRLKGWFSRLLTLPGWFDQELTASDTHAYVLSAEGGVFAFIGADAAFVLPVEVGYTAISRQKITRPKPPVTLRHYMLRAEGGHISFIGNVATLRRGYAAQALSASFAVVGAAARLRKHSLLAADAVQLMLDGADASLLAHRLIHVAAGQVAFAVASASFFVDRSRTRALLAALDDEWLFLQEVA